MASNLPTFETKVLMDKGKRATAMYIQNDCYANGPCPKNLNAILDNLLNPVKSIDEWDTIEWCKWLMAGGRTPDEFCNLVRTYDNATTCGLVWTPNFVAYRCKTCGISPCMSLCRACFKKGNHHRHDFNMFLSQAGGACDCGDTSVMKETGFCNRHGPNKSCNKDKEVPHNLMAVAEAMMPRILFRLILHLRENWDIKDGQKCPIQDADGFLTMLLDFNIMGCLMRRVMTSALTNPQKYRELNEIPENVNSEYAQYLLESKRLYEEALKSLPNPEPLEEYKNCPSLQENLIHKTMLEELVFWTVKYEFPQRVVCLLLNILPDPDYKEALTRAFVLHYSRISMMLERSGDPDTLSNRVVHISVQLFSNERLALKMTEELNLLHVMVVSLRSMMSKILIPNTLHDSNKNFHYVVDCAKSVMKEHCYWPLVSDLNNVLSHRPVALKFMSDDMLVEMWFEFLAMFQGMNVNQREMNQHVEFEPNTYYAAFSAELEASAYPMWALVSHLNDNTTQQLTRRLLTTCLKELQDWLDGINFTSPNVNDNLQVSFHLPLHRYFSVFLCQAVAKQGICLNEILPSDDTLMLMMMHPLRVQVAFYEILNGLWVRNGLQIKGQAMTYIQCNFCNSMVDADLYLLQICCTKMCADKFLNIVIDKFHVKEWMSLAPYHPPQNPYLEPEHDTAMLESFLTFLATLVTVRTNIGLCDLDLNRLEMITLLCMSDKTHSQLIEFMPERCGQSQSRDFETLLNNVANYRPPTTDASGNLQQGMYSPKSHVWENLYDPIHVLLRAIHRKDFQTSMDRYTEYVRHSNKLKSGDNPWPPFRNPMICGNAYDDPRQILKSKVFHAVALIVLHKAVRGLVSEHVMALIVFLLEQAVVISQQTDDKNTKMCPSSSQFQPKIIKDMDMENWFQSDSLFENLRTQINKILLVPEPEVSPAMTFSSSDDSDLEWEDNNDTEMISNEMHIIENDDDDDDDNNTIIDSNNTTNNPNMLMVTDSSWTNLSDNQTRDLLIYLQQNQQQQQQTERNYDNTALALPSSPLPLQQEQSPMDIDNMAIAVPTNHRHSSSPTTSEQPAILPPTQLPALIAGNEVGRTATNWTQMGIVDTTSGSSTDLVPSTSTHRKTYFRRRQTVEGGETKPPTVRLNDSIISLLIKLHSQLSGIPDSYNIDDEEGYYNNTLKINKEEEEEEDKEEKEEIVENLIGDGPYFIGKLLKKLSQLDENCKLYIQEVRMKLWPSNEEREDARKQKKNKEKEERRRRAKERQQQFLADFRDRQKRFMEKTMEQQPTTTTTNHNTTSSSSTTKLNSSTDDDSDKCDDDIVISKQEYDCVICNQSTPSTEDKPMGLVVLVQATSVIGHRRRFGQPERSVLPTCEEEKHLLRRDDTLAAEFDRRLEEMDRNFDPKSWYLSVNLGWDGGVHVQTCGHHLHLDCLNSYLQSLRSQQRQLNLYPEKGEYLCPLCRQLANSVLPLAPQLGDCAQMVISKPLSMSQILDEIGDFLRENDQKPSNSNMAEAIGKIMEVMTSSTQLKPMFKPKSDKPIPQSLFLFVTSIARTNLEVELIQRGGTLVTSQNEPINPLLPKRNCIVPLLHVLSVHARVARVLAMWPAWVTFQQLCGLPPKPPADNTALAPIEREVPLLLKDPIALILQFVLLLPLHLDQTYFTTTVQMVYNLLYYQVVAQISCGLTGNERRKATLGANFGKIINLTDALALVNQYLGDTDLYMMEDDQDDNGGASCSSTSPSKSQINIIALEQQLEKLCLPFLRIAALLKHHIYKQQLPDINIQENEFVRLVYYLELITESQDWDSFNAANALNWPRNTQMYYESPQSWFNQYRVFIQKSQIAARSFLIDQHITWHPPRLLQLPEEYEKIFTYYHGRPCNSCHSVPQETSICLLCGTIVCLKQVCCKQQNICEATAHASECGAGTGIFLVVTSTYIIVIRGHRACLWGSLYLDEFEEEDRDLKRGKPLFLSKDRYRLLEQQWLAHRFDHTKKTWLQHRNAL